MPTQSPNAHRVGQWALFSGVVGVVAVGLLIAALAAPTPSPSSMRRETSLFAWQNAGVILQALGMIPVTLGLHALGPNKSHGPSFNLKLGVIAQISLVVASALLFTGAVSDMLYMAPIGLVGLWLLRFNRAGNALCSPALAWSGRIAGVGLCAIGLGFVIYGLTVAPAVFIRPLTPAEIDAQALTPGNLVAHILMLVGTLIGRLVYPFWTIALGQRLMKLQE